MLHNWLHRYVTSDSQAGPLVKAKLPLREARVSVAPRPGKAGSYFCTLQLWPHLHDCEARFVARMIKGGSGPSISGP